MATFTAVKFSPPSPLGKFGTYQAGSPIGLILLHQNKFSATKINYATANSGSSSSSNSQSFYWN